MRRAGLVWLWLLSTAMAAPAAAQSGMPISSGQATAHLGVADGTDGRGATLSLGGSLAVINVNGWGAELDFGWADDDGGRSGGLAAQTYTLNLVGMWPKGRLRPFMVGGGGVMRARTCVADCADTLGWTDWVLTGGGGVQYRLNEIAALRGDVRYFGGPGHHPDPARPQGFGFWRFAVGATFLWDVE